MEFWLSSLEQGLIFGIMILGVYISYKILDFPDMTVDGAFPMGAAIVGSGLISGLNPFLCLILATIGGALAGLITGILHVKFKIRDLLAGILVMTALYSINLRIMGKPNIHLFNVKHIFNFNIKPIVVFNYNINSIIIVLIILLTVKFILDFLLKTEFGFALRALGDNEKLIISLGINEKRLKIIGLMIANSMVALAGGVLAQHQGYADIGMGTGTIVAGLASIILGEGIMKNFKNFKMTNVVLIGSILYRMVIAFALRQGLKATDLKLVTALIVVIILIPKVNFWLNAKNKAGEIIAKN